MGKGKRSTGTSLFAPSATFCFLFLSLYLFLCFQLPSNVIVYLVYHLLEGVLSYNPRFEEVSSSPSIIC